MRIAFRALTTLALLAALAATGVAQPTEEGRGRDIHFRGPVFALSRDLDENVVQLTVRVNQSQIAVQVTGWTEVIQGRGFRSGRNDLALGDFIQVGGFFTSTGRIMARRIHVENRDGLELEGRVEMVSGNLVRVDGIDFLVDSSSVLRAAGSRGQATLSGLSQGMPVRIRASEDGGLWLIRELELGERTVESEPLRFEGIVRKIEGDLVSIDVGIEGVWALVAVPYGTLITGSRELRVGLLVEIEGRFLPGTALVRAERVAVDSNRNQNIFDDADEDGPAAVVELEGRIQDLRRGGDGNPLQFRLNETVVQLDGQTRLHWRQGDPADGRDLEEGLPVKVEGRPLRDRLVLAIRIELQPRGGDDSGSGDSTEEGSGGESSNGDSSDDGDSDADAGDNGSGEGDSEEGAGDRDPDEGDSEGDAGDDDSTGGEEPPGQDGTGQAVSLAGPIESLSRQPDGAVTLIVVAGTPIHVTGQTTILNLAVSPGIVTSAALQVGQEVEIVGVRRNDGSVRAERIQILKG